MTDGSSPLHLHRREPARNMARFYRLSIARDLFGRIVVLREWGRIGTRGRQIEEGVSDIAAAHRRLLRIAASKRQRGYFDVIP